MTRVVIARAVDRLQEALEEVFAPFGGVEQALPQRGGTLYVKPNLIHYTPETFTDAGLIEALLATLRDHGYSRLAVMENCTGGNLTRLVFRVTGVAALCRRYGARAVYLDEGPTVEVQLEGEDHPTHIPRLLHDEIVQRGDNTYLSVPKLKTHSMSTVTLGVKNQQAFPVDAERMVRHDRDTLHARLVSLFQLARPDFCLVEGLTATQHGHFPPTALLDECVVPMGILVGGRDTLAVDTVAARILGYEVAEVEHLRLCAERGLGEADLSRIEVVGEPLASFSERLPHTLLGRFHPEVRIVEGRDKACVEGCKGNSECILQMLSVDFDGGGGWSLVFGQGFTGEDLADLPGDILVVGPCAVAEVGDALAERYPDRTVYRVNAHNDLMNNTRYQARLAGVTPVKMVPINPVAAAWTLLVAKLHGLTSRVPPLLG